MPWLVGGIDHMATDQELGDVLARPGRSDNLAQPVTEEQQNETAEEDRIPLIQKIIYGCGGFANNTLAAAIRKATPQNRPFW